MEELLDELRGGGAGGGCLLPIPTGSELTEVGVPDRDLSDFGRPVPGGVNPLRILTFI